MWRSVWTTFAGSVFGIVCAAATASASPAASAEALAPYVTRLEAMVDPRAGEALRRIDGLGRRLLAVRAYLRAGTALGDRWSWSEPQIEAFEGSVEQQALLAQIDLVRKAFERLNPGYTLFVNERVRSLDEQLVNWNANESVGAAAANLEAATTSLLASAGWPPAATDRTLRDLVAFLDAHVPEPTPTLAAPGLSPHGQMNAVDFHVYRGDQEVATPDAATIETVWTAHGWSDRLARAVRESGARFSGPLEVPREPWHYRCEP